MTNIGGAASGKAIVSNEMARLIANFAIFLQFTDENALDLDAGVEAMEQLGGDIQELDPATRQSLADALLAIAPSYRDAEARQFVEDMPEALGITDLSRTRP